MALICKIKRQNVKGLDCPSTVHNLLTDLVERFAQWGLVHCDFNEFNVMVDNNKKIWVIDFPQIVSTKHKNAEFFFQRDLKCINDFFERRFGYVTNRKSVLGEIKRVADLDELIKAVGYEGEKSIDVGDTRALVGLKGRIL